MNEMALNLAQNAHLKLRILLIAAMLLCVLSAFKGHLSIMSFQGLSTATRIKNCKRFDAVMSDNPEVM